MPIFHPADAVTFETHGSRFDSYLRPANGSTQLCAWRLTVPADLVGVPHRPSVDEIVLVLEGELHIILDGVATALRPGDVAFVPAEAEFQVDGGPACASAWVTTTPGLAAVTPDGSRITPPWVA